MNLNLTKSDLRLLDHLNTRPAVWPLPDLSFDEMGEAIIEITAMQVRGWLLNWMLIPVDVPGSMCSTCAALRCHVFTYCGPQYVYYRHEMDTTMILKVEVESLQDINQTVLDRAAWLNALHDNRN